jgi:D-alanine-D-alanine ligase
MKRVTVLMGGPSAEREVSLASGANCAAALAEAGYQVATIDVGRDLKALIDAIDSQKPDVLFNALHGRWVEDGNIQGVLNFIGIPYTHSGLMASAIAMDKPMAKRVFAAAGLRCPEGVILDKASVERGDVMARPYVVKPANEGSSVGVAIVA